MEPDEFCLKKDIPLGAVTAPLLRWYEKNARVLPWRENTDPYRVFVSEIMLQQTRVDTVIPYYERFLRALPDVTALSAVPEDELLKLWEGLGYYSRARNLQKAAQMICREYGGVFPAGFEQVRALPGVGPYTAGAICSIAFGQPTPAVDGNVLRVVSRLCRNGTDIANPAYKKRVTAVLAQIYPARECGAFTQSLMELGAVVCLPNGVPLCDRCPLAELCAARAAGEQLAFPVQSEKAARRIVEMTVFRLTCGGRTAIRRRGAGLLAGLWELPSADGFLSPEEARDRLCAAGLHPGELSSAGMKKHIFTHIEWRMLCFCAECAEPGGDFVWATAEQLAAEFPLPTAFKKLLPSSER